MGKHSDESNCAVKIEQSYDSTQLYYLNMDKPSFRHESSMNNNYVGYTARNQCQQNITAELHLLYRETAKCYRMYLFEDHVWFKQLFHW